MITLPVKPWSKTLGPAFVSELSARAGLYGLMAVYWTSGFGLGMFYDRPVKPWIYAPIFAALFVVIGLIYILRSARHVSRQRASGDEIITLGADLKSTIVLGDVARVALLLTGFSITISVFQSVKAMIPTIQPFVHDALFAQMDKALHGGLYPHELLQPLLGYPVVSFVLLLLYNFWLPLVFVVFLVQLLNTANAALQHRYLVSFLLAWIVIGTLGALVLSSAGPAYYEPVLGLAAGSGPYSDLMAYYGYVGESLPFFLTDMQGMLWQFYQSGTCRPGADFGDAQRACGAGDPYVSDYAASQRVGGPDIWRLRSGDICRFGAPGLALRGRWLSGRGPRRMHLVDIRGFWQGEGPRHSTAT